MKNINKLYINHLVPLILYTYT